MHLNAKNALRRMKRTVRWPNPGPLDMANARFMTEGIERGKDLLRAIPQLTEVVLHIPQLHPTGGWVGSKRRKGERVVVTRRQLEAA